MGAGARGGRRKAAAAGWLRCSWLQLAVALALACSLALALHLSLLGGLELPQQLFLALLELVDVALHGVGDALDALCIGVRRPDLVVVPLALALWGEFGSGWVARWVGWVRGSEVG